MATVQPSLPKSSSTVTVACNFPTGFELYLCREEKFWEESRDSKREVVRHVKTGKPVFIYGTSYPVGPVPKGYGPKPAMVGGYALTFNVNAEFFAEWMKQNRENPIVVNKCIMAAPDRASTVAMAKECKDVRSGYEPLVPDTDPRLPKPIIAGLTRPETADEMKSRESFQMAEMGTE